MSEIVTRELWNSLRYPVSLRQMPDDEGSYWLAGIPMLGEGLFIADGDTPQEALDILEDRRRSLYDNVIASGRPIPLPSQAIETIEVPSGKWLQRTSPQFHAELKEAARRHNSSLNEYCNQCLQRGHAVHSMFSASEEVLSKLFTSVQPATTNAKQSSNLITRHAERRFKMRRVLHNAHKRSSSTVFHAPASAGVAVQPAAASALKKVREKTATVTCRRQTLEDNKTTHRR